MATAKKDNSSIIAALIGSFTSIVVTFMSVVLPKLLEIGTRPKAVAMVQEQAAPSVKGAQVIQQVQQVQSVQAPAPDQPWWNILIPSSDNVTGEAYIVIGIALAIAFLVWIIHRFNKHKK
jgi:hypothetical protein